MSLPPGAKATVKRWLRPLAAPMLARIQNVAAALEGRLATVEAQVGALEAALRAEPGSRLLQNLARGWAHTELRLRRLEKAVAAGGVAPAAKPPAAASPADASASPFERLLYPSLSLHNWQMQDSERMALTGLLHRLRPGAAVEIGVYWGGSLQLIAGFAEKVWALDIDPEVPQRLTLPDNVDLRIGDSAALIPELLAEIDAQGLPLNLVLIDADHRAEGVKRDIELVLRHTPRAQMAIVMHDSGNPGCRAGIRSANWAANPHVCHVDLDFVPGVLIAEGEKSGGEVWGGLALALLQPERREGALTIREGAAATIAALHSARG